MSDTSDSGSDFDPRFGNWPAPAGTATAFGATAQDTGNQPLVDWVKNLRPNDLANFLHDPQAHSADMAAAGVPPPTDEQMQAIHAHNDTMGTPTRSSRTELQADNGPLYGPVPDPSQGNLTRGMQPGSVYMSGSVGEKQPQDPNKPKSGGTISDPIVEGLKKWSQSGGGPTQFHRPGENVPREPNVPGAGRPTAQAPAPPPAEKVVPVPVQPAPAPAPAAPAPAQPPPPTLQTPSPLEPAAEGEKKKKPGEEEPQTKLQKAGDAISELGKAMQGVKAPEPLKPPNIGAPGVRASHPAGAPQVTQLASLLSGVQGGQVPASTLPVLRLLGRA